MTFPISRLSFVSKKKVVGQDDRFVKASGSKNLNKGRWDGSCRALTSLAGTHVGGWVSRPSRAIKKNPPCNVNLGQQLQEVDLTYTWKENHFPDDMGSSAKS